MTGSNETLKGSRWLLGVQWNRYWMIGIKLYLSDHPAIQMKAQPYLPSTFLLLFLVAHPLSNVYGQDTCPFSDQEAVADTLDSAAYLPMQIGNVWEYTVKDGAFSDDPYREEVISDTLIENTLFYKIRRISFDYNPVIITHADTSYRYQAITDTSIVYWRNDTIEPTPIRFSQEFNSCYEPSSGGQIVVAGGYNRSFDIEYRGNSQAFAAPALKEIGSTFFGTTYAWGIGQVKISGDPSVITSLVYASVDGIQYGTRLTDRFSISVGNAYDLVPENWFPLELGSTWHYEYMDGAFVWDVVKQADRDTLIGENRWVGISTIYCDLPPYCPVGISTRWYRFAEEGYLLRYLPNADPDTVDVTYPYSIFRVQTAIDTLYSSHDHDSVTVRIDSTDFGSEVDSTNLLLSVDWPFPYDHSQYLYKIGDAYRLVGASVGALKVGDTDFLTRVSTKDEAIIPLRPTIELYPYPMRSNGAIRIKDMDVGLHTITVFDLVGRQMASMQFTALRQEQEVLFKGWPQTSGYYVLVLETPDGQRVSRSMIYLSK